MNDDDITPGPDLEPTPPLPEGAPGPEAAAAPGDPAAAVPATEMTAATPPGAPPPTGPSWKTWVAVAGGAVVVGAAAVFGISAATSSGSSSADAATQQPVTNSAPNGYGPGPGGLRTRFAGRGTAGTITSIDGSTLTVSDRQQSSTTKVKTTSKTKVTTTEDGSFADVKVGDTVMVVGTKSDDAIAATRVSDDGKVSAADQQGPGGRRFGGPPPGATGGQGNTAPQGGPGSTPPQGGNGYGPPGGFVGNGNGPGMADGTSFTRGEVQSVGDGTYTVKGMDGVTVTVTTSSSTKFSVTKDASPSDLKVGDTIVATGKTANGVLTATRIREGAMGGGFFRGGAGFPGGPSGQDGGNGSSSSSSSSGAGPQ